MTISIPNNVGSSKRRALSFLLMFVYLLVVNYSISHVHGPAKSTQDIPTTWAEVHADDDHHHSDQQHSHACTLIAQTAASFADLQSATLFASVFNPLPRYLSLNLTTPTKRHTRAPPIIKT